MASSKSSELFDPVRKGGVKITPEERVRQRLISRMVKELGFPLAFLAVEKELKLLPHLRLIPSNKIPRRRIDIVAFAKGIHPDYPLFPLLLVECKAVALTPKVARQVVGYNDVVKAPFVAVANEDHILTGGYDAESGLFRFQEGLPTYTQLLSALESNKI